MNLNHLLKAHDVNLSLKKVKLVRHKINNPEERKLIEKYDSAFLCMQSIQNRNVFNGCDHIFSFMADKDGNTIFKGIFKVGIEQHFSPDKIRKQENEIQEFYKKTILTDHYWYEQEKLPLLDDYVDRLVIDWGGSERVWAQNYHTDNSKKIIAIRPEGSEGIFREFPGYLNFSLSRNELNKLFRNAEANYEWRISLSRIKAVYLILDEKTGQQYVGSAYGQDGLWGRWRTYFDDPTGGNKLLKNLLKFEKNKVDKFRYSIIEVLSSTLADDEVIKREVAVKEKLGSRAHGLNSN